MNQQHDDDIGNREDIVIERLRMANQFLQDALTTMKLGSYNTAADRAYYSIFKSISALHITDGNTFRSHKSLLSTFNKNYIHTGIFPKEFGAKVYSIQDLRHASDYGDFQTPSRNDVIDAIQCATDLMYATRKYCQSRMKKSIDLTPAQEENEEERESTR